MWSLGKEAVTLARPPLRRLASSMPPFHPCAQAVTEMTKPRPPISSSLHVKLLDSERKYLVSAPKGIKEVQGSPGLSVPMRTKDPLGRPG